MFKYCFRKHKAFLWGILAASVTWIICIYLYLQLNYRERHLPKHSQSLLDELKPIIQNNDSGEKETFFFELSDKEEFVLIFRTWYVKNI